MRYRLLVLDLDDTLLGSDKQISPANLTAVAAARAVGCEVTFVTARAPRSVMAYIEQVGVTLPIISMTGAALYQPDGTPIRFRPLANASLRRLVSLTDELDLACRLYFASGLRRQSRLASDFELHPLYNAPELFVSPLSPLITADDPVVQLAFFGRRATRAVLDLLPSLPSTIATPYDVGLATERVHIMHEQATKGGALAALCQELGITRNQVIAMGDADPDASMLQWAGVGVAMGWGTEAAKAAANLVTPGDEPDGVAWALRRLMGVHSNAFQ